MSNPLNPLYDAVAWVIVHIHSVVSLVINPNGGLAWLLSIVILVVAMRLLLVPLFIKQMHSMRKMSALAPHMAELRKKYKNDKQTLNEETMKLYKENGVNPLGGCLPLVAQLPLFFALFGVLRQIAEYSPKSKLAPPYGLTRSVIESAQSAKILGATLADKVLFTGTLHVPLVAKVVIVCAVLISVATTYLTVRQSTKRGMTPQMTPDNPMAASQKYMNYIVPLFALSGLYWQFGLVMYWVTTNVWTLGQQHVLFKRYPPPKVTAPVTGGTATGSTSASPAGTKRPASGAKSGSASARPARPGGTPAKSPSAGAGGSSAKATPATRAAAKPSTGSASSDAAAAGKTKNGQATRASGQRPAAASRPASETQQANGSGLLRRLSRTRAEEEPPAAEPEVKLVRQQPARQPRSKRSGKR